MKPSTVEPSVFVAASVVTPAHRRVTKSFGSPLLGGPPYSELLEEISAHLFTEDEAALVQHLLPLRPRTAEAVARAAGCDAPSARAVLDRLALDKMVILAFGEPRKYALLPVVPGTFELALMTTDLRTRTDWHKRFAVLFERLWDTGFMRDYSSSTRPPVRYLPVGVAIENTTTAWPSDRLEEILADYDDFAVRHCQCRLAMLSDGSVWASGWNCDGQLGLDIPWDCSDSAHTTPDQVLLDPYAVAIGAGRYHSLAILDDGVTTTAWAWGNNASGQLGIGSSGADELAPVEITGF